MRINAEQKQAKTIKQLKNNCIETLNEALVEIEMDKHYGEDISYLKQRFNGALTILYNTSVLNKEEFDTYIDKLNEL